MEAYPIVEQAVDLLWPTSVAVVASELTPSPGLVRHLAAPPPDLGPHRSVEPWPAERLIAEPLEQLAAEAADVVSRLSAAADVDLHWRGEIWRPGHSTLFRSSAGPFQAICYIHEHRSREVSHLAGSLEIHDPRPGCSAAYAPGGPFGRPLRVEPRSGLWVVLPGWLEWSIKPISRGQVLAVLLLDSCRRESDREPTTTGGAP